MSFKRQMSRRGIKGKSLRRDQAKDRAELRRLDAEFIERMLDERKPLPKRSAGP